MEPTDDRLEVGDVQRVRVHAAVPADDVERMVAMDEPRQAGPVAHEHRDGIVGHVGVDHHEFGRRPQVALAVRRMFEELAEARQVLGRRGDVAAAGDDQRAERLVIRHHPAVRRRGGDHHVVAGTDVERAEHRLEPTVAVLHEHQLVADRVAVQPAVGAGLDPRDLDVVVGEQHGAPEHEIGVGAARRVRRCGCGVA